MSTAPGPWPVKSGLNLIPGSRLDSRPESEIVASLQEPRPVTGERNIWAFWHSGFSNAPPWTRRTVINWVRRLPTWSIRVLDSVPGSPSHFHRFVPPALLPDALNNNAMTGPYVGPHSSDLIRLPLVYLHGGVWMDVGTLLFRDLDNICWSQIEDPESPIEMAGFTLPSGDGPAESTLLNSFIAAKKGNQFVRRWHDIFLEVWKGASECKGLHAHPLLKHIPRPGEVVEPADKSPNRDDGQDPPNPADVAGSEPQPTSKLPWSRIPSLQVQQELADYGAQFLYFDRLRLLEDPTDGFNGPDYLAEHALFFNGMQECLLAQQLTCWDGTRQFELLATTRAASSNRTDAENFADNLVRDSCQTKIFSHGRMLGVSMLGKLWEQPGNEETDYAEGTYAAYLRFASVHLEQSRVMQPQKMKPSRRRKFRVGLLEDE